MRPLFMLPVALVIAATSASAQTVLRDPAPPAYLCTPDAQVIKVTDAATRSLLTFRLPQNNKTTNVVPVPAGSSSAGISECVLGPDGLLYAARGYSIVRFPINNPADTDVKLVANLDTAVTTTGVAFNVDTLYVSTSENKTIAIPGATRSVLPINGPFGEVGAGAGGVAFGIDGKLVVSSPGTPSGVVKSYAPPSYGGTAADVSVTTPKGVAIDPCGDILVADKNSKSVKRLPAGSAAVQFPVAGADYPVHLEVEPGGRVVVVTVQNDSGLNGKLWLANFDFKTTNCGSVTPTLLVNLSSLLSGSSKLQGLASSLASGVAVAPSNIAITQDFAPGPEGDCVREFNFGYHQARFTFPDCSIISGALKITAVKSLFAAVDFTASVDPTNALSGMRYSALGGHVIQYLLEPFGALKTLSDQNPSQLPEFKAKYGFFTQEIVGEPGVAKENTGVPAAKFDQLVGIEYWDVGSLDPGAGERERDFSKRVVYNKDLTFLNCAVPDILDNNFGHQNPLYNGGQNIRISFTASGTNCAGATVRLSIVRVFDATLNASCQVISSGPAASYETQTVQATNGADGNVFDVVGSSYRYNLDTSVLNTEGATPANPAQFLVTIWGQLAPPKNFCFRSTKQ